MKYAKVSFSDAGMMDILEQAEWYQQHSGEALAGKWENAVASAILQLSKNPDAGSSCKFRNAELADTRRIGIPQFRNTLSSIPLLVGN